MMYYTIDKTLINKLREELSKDKNVIIAILFGSATRRKKVRDIDIAVLLEDGGIKNLLKLLDRISKVIDINVDLVPLDNLREDVAYEILVNGIPILVRDEKILTNLKLRYMLLYLEMQELYSSISKSYSLKANRL